jgi:hypothetical protein
MQSRIFVLLFVLSTCSSLPTAKRSLDSHEQLHTFRHDCFVPDRGEPFTAYLNHSVNESRILLDWSIYEGLLNIKHTMHPANGCSREPRGSMEHGAWSMEQGAWSKESNTKLAYIDFTFQHLLLSLIMQCIAISDFICKSLNLHISCNPSQRVCGSYLPALLRQEGNFTAARLHFSSEMTLPETDMGDKDSCINSHFSSTTMTGSHIAAAAAEHETVVASTFLLQSCC